MKRQVGQLNLQIKQNEELKVEVDEGLAGMEAREQQVATLEGAVQSLKQIIKQNTGRISGLQQEVESSKTEARKKDREMQAIRGQLSQSRQSIEDLQTILGDAGKTIDAKNGQIEALQRRVETFKQDKKNLLGIVQQLATIGNPAFNFKSFMDHFDEKEEEEDVNTFSASEEVRAFKTAPLFTQESQRSSRTNVAKDRSGGGRRNKKQQSRKQLQSIPRGKKRPEEGSFSQHQRRSFPASTINSIKAEVEKKAAAAAAAEKQKQKKKLKEVLEVDEYDYEYDAAVPAPAATKHFDVEKADKKKKTAEAINIFVNIEEKETSTPFTSFQQALGDFPSFVNMADKLNEVLPEILTPETTSTSTTTTTTSTTTTASTTPPTRSTKVFFTTTTTAPDTTTLTIPPVEETVGIDWNPVENDSDSNHSPIFVGMETVEIAPKFTVERVETSESKRRQSLNRVFQSTPSSSSQSQPKPFKSSQSEEEVSQAVKSKAFKPSQAEPKQPKLSRVFKPSRRKHGRKVPNARKRFGQKVASSRY